jgi:hypothetical protein
LQRLDRRSYPRYRMVGVFGHAIDYFQSKVARIWRR